MKWKTLERQKTTAIDSRRNIKSEYVPTARKEINNQNLCTKKSQAPGTSLVNSSKTLIEELTSILQKVQDKGTFSNCAFYEANITMKQKLDRVSRKDNYTPVSLMNQFSSVQLTHVPQKTTGKQNPAPYEKNYKP